MQNSKRNAMTKEAFLLLISMIFPEVVPPVNSFNLDDRYFKKITHNSNEYFGYSIAFRKESYQYKILVGSPKANDASFDSSPGALYECNIEQPYNCRIIQLNLQIDLSMSRQDQWLGVAMDINPVDSHIIVCAHRFLKHYYYSDSLRGVCYELNNTSSPQKPIKQFHVDYFNANTGTSCRYSQLGGLLIGAPGIVLDFKSGGYILNGQLHLNTKNDYYEGYTVAFLDQTPVIGKPRYYEYGAVDVQSELIQSPKTKYSFGSYFGSAIATADLNQDGHKDLVIGAPFYSETFTEEGRVYIYFFNSFVRKFDKDANVILMELSPRAQFGKSLVTGDFNQDQYEDVIVGAPYENDGTGCIYVYNGKNGGLDSTYSQKINGETLGKGLQSFGISFSRSVDLDQNGYADIGVGAYLSDSVYIFKARPTFSVKANLIVSNPILDITPNCTHNDRLVLCVNLTVTLNISAQVPMKYHYHLITDSSKSTDAKRTYFNGRLHEITETVIVRQKLFKTYQIFIKNAFDILKPINFTLHYSLYDHGYSRSCLPLCPISKNGTVNQIVKFNIDCGSDEICRTRLKVKVEIFPTNIILGQDKKLRTVVNVLNQGEHAYNAKMRIFFSSSMDFESVSQPANSSVECTTVNKMELSCFLGNPLKTYSKSFFTLNFLTDQISNETKVFVAVNASTDSLVLPKYFVNTVNSTILVFRKFNLELAATSVPDTLVFTGKEGPMIARHVYNLRNNGPSNAFKLIFSVDIPYFFINNSPLITIKEYRMHSGNRDALDISTGVVCHLHSVEDTAATAAELKTGIQSLIKHRNIANCSWLKCHRIICELNSLPVVNTKIFELALSINTGILKQFQDKVRVFNFVSNGTLRNTRNQILFSHGNATTSYIVTRLPKKIQWWIVILSILIGLFFLIMAGLILWKLGFFKRNRISAEDRKSLAVANENAAASKTEPQATES